MKQGITSRQDLIANQVVTADATLVTLDGGVAAQALSFPVARGKAVHFRAVIPFSVGASGGYKFQLTLGGAVPAAYVNAQEVNDGVTATPGAQIVSVITAEAPFANAFASVAGNHVMTMEGTIYGNASVDAVIALQMACNSAAGAITALKGGYLEITQL